MIPSFLRHNPIKILIPSKASLILFFLGWFFYISISISCATISSNFLAMKVHPLLKKRTLPNSTETMTHHQKKLRRLPHVFNRVLELPLKSDADVSVEESSDWFKFVFPVTEKLCRGDVRAHAIEIHPGVVKIVVKGSGGVGLLQLDELKLDMWRYRLPASTRPDKVTAVCVGGQLVVTVPKGGEVQKAEDGDGEIWDGVGRLVLVQYAVLSNSISNGILTIFIRKLHGLWAVGRIHQSSLLTYFELKITGKVHFGCSWQGQELRYTIVSMAGITAYIMIVLMKL